MDNSVKRNLQMESCTKSPDKPDESLPPTDSTSNNQPPVSSLPYAPGDLVVRRRSDNTALFSFAFTYDSKHRLSNLRVYHADTVSPTDYQFFYTSASENFPTNYNIVEHRSFKNDTTYNKIIFANNVPVGIRW